jgi:hypothetical protein
MEHTLTITFKERFSLDESLECASNDKLVHKFLNGIIRVGLKE